MSIKISIYFLLFSLFFNTSKSLLGAAQNSFDKFLINVKQLVNSKAHVNFMNKNGNNALMEATRGYFYSEWNSHFYKTDRWCSGPDCDSEPEKYLKIVLEILNPGPLPREDAGEIRQNLNRTRILSATGSKRRIMPRIEEKYQSLILSGPLKEMLEKNC